MLHRWNLFNSILQSLDPSLSRWSNLLILMGYPFGFHFLALASSFLQTRPKSFWAPLEDWKHARAPTRYPHRDELARAGATAAAPIVAVLAPIEPDEPAASHV